MLIGGLVCLLACAGGPRASLDGSSQKVERLVGPKTEARWGIVGTDLGVPFELDGRVCFAFGDTLGPGHGDPIACTGARRGDQGVELDFLEDAEGRYLRIRPDGEGMGPFEVPTGALVLGKRTYLIVRRRVDEQWTSSVVEWHRDEHRFSTVRALSRLPDGKFVQASARRAPRGVSGLPEGGPWVLIWGTSTYRKSPAWLAIVPESGFATGEGTLFFTGLQDGRPRWSVEESDAVPVIDTPTIGELSVAWVDDAKLWLAAYDQRDPLSVVMRTASAPWGPFDAPVTVLTPRQGAGTLFHVKGRDDGLAGPVIGQPQDLDKPGGPYGAYVVERFTRSRGDKLDVYYLLSTWNPYTVLLMHTQLDAASR